MRLEFDGISVWYGTPDAPAPAGVVPGDDPVAVTIGVHPPDASNSVEVRYRIDGSPIQIVRAGWMRTAADGSAQYFRARFPRLKPGERVEFTPVCRRAGRQAPPPADTDRLLSSFTVAGISDSVRQPSPAIVLGAAERRTGIMRPPASALSAFNLHVPRPVDGPFPAGPRRDNDDDPGGPDKPEQEVEFAVQIKSPANEHAHRPGVLEMLGTTTKTSNVTFTGVTVAIGGNLPKPAQQTGPGWSKWSFSANIATPGKVSIVVTAFAKFPPQGTGKAEDSVTIIVDGTSPTVKITKMEPGSTVEGPGPAFPVTIKGTASDGDGSGVKSVAVVVGSGETFAANTGDTWKHWESLVTLRGAGVHDVTAVATDRAGNTAAHTGQITARDTAPPTIAVTQPAPLPDTISTPIFEVRGTAADGTGIDSVLWKMDAGDFKPAFKVKDDWTEWRALITVPGPGEHTVTFSAHDVAEPPNQTPPIVWKFAVPELGELQGTSPSAYLRDLLLFISERVVEDPDITPPKSVGVAALEKAFFQPFERLDDATGNDVATRVVSQARVSIEVLRRFLNVQGAEGERQYREAAYTHVLQSLGTSYEEIRLARGADQKTRRALADRLGIALASPRPNDELDQLLLTPERLAKPASEKDLESLFGIVDTRRDPLTDGPQPLLLKWKKQYLRAQWAVQDAPTDLPTERPWPVVDPDNLTEADFTGTPESNAAYALWQARSTWVEEKIAELRKKSSAASPLQQFDKGVALGVGALDLEALAAQHATGVEPSDKTMELSQVLEQKRLSLGGFLHLVRIRRLAAAGPVLDTEWDDVFSILVQSVKEREQYDPWLEDETRQGVMLGPDHFTIAPSVPARGPQPAASRWRRDPQVRKSWEQRLKARINQEEAVREGVGAAVSAAEEAVLPQLRDTLIASIDPGDPNLDLAEWITRRLQIDVRTSGRQRTTRVQQAIETLQGMLFSLRTERLTAIPPVTGDIPFLDWGFTTKGYSEAEFDEEWRWIGSYDTWRAAAFVFGYPENYLLPSLLPVDDQTPAFATLISEVRLNLRFTPDDARKLAADYETQTDEESGKTPVEELQVFVDAANTKLVASGKKPIDAAIFRLTERRSAEQLRTLQSATALLFEHGAFDKAAPPRSVAEICYFVPVLLALQLHKAGQFLTALDWFQCVYAYNFPLQQRKVYRGLVEEEKLPDAFIRPPQWLLGLNPHVIVRLQSPRGNAYTRFTVFALVRCFLDFADGEFTAGTNEAVTRARTLYMAAADLLDAVVPASTAAPEGISFPPNPVPAALRLHAEINLLKLRSGRNIAGLERISTIDQPAGGSVPVLGAGGQIVLPATVLRPTPYRFAALVARAKELAGIAQQVEAAYLAALEKRDAEAYSLLQAHQHIELARATVKLQNVRIGEAWHGVTLAERQFERVQIQRQTYEDWIDGGLSWKEQTSLALMGTAAVLHAAAGAGGLLNIVKLDAASSISQLASAASATAGLFSTWASFERREDEWQLQADLAKKDEQIGLQHIAGAHAHVRVVNQERQIAGIQLDHSQAAAEFLATKFTNADLYDFMSGVLGQVYAYFLQQATATAALAEAQLAFERQETLPGIVQVDYWQPQTAAGDGGSADRRGITGSVRLLQDIYRLDQHAFETRKRMLQLSQTLSLSQLAPVEFELFRQTGVLPFSTPMTLFDRGFPGHYVRLIKRVRVSILALVPPAHGVRATLTSSGLSRVVISDMFGTSFQPVLVHRVPEQIAFTAPTNATGLLELEPEGDLLLPFEGTGVDTTWELALPKPANPIDYGAIADVLVTLEYTALHNGTYRETVIRQMDRQVTADRAFSLRNHFPDAFYALNNPLGADGPMSAAFETRRADFPPHLTGLAIDDVLVYFARRPVAVDDSEAILDQIPVAHLLFTPPGETTPLGGQASAGKDGIVSTRRANGNNWSGMAGAEPTGTWELALGEPMRPFVLAGVLEDVVLVISCSGLSPAWPG